jgi:hypothetical protein
MSRAIGTYTDHCLLIVMLVRQGETKPFDHIEEKIKLIKGSLEEALYSKDSRSKNLPIIRSLRLLIELRRELEKIYQRQ